MDSIPSLRRDSPREINETKDYRRDVDTEPNTDGALLSLDTTHSAIQKDLAPTVSHGKIAINDTAERRHRIL